MLSRKHKLFKFFLLPSCAIVLSAASLGIQVHKGSILYQSVLASAAHPADINNDGLVGVADLSYLIGKWGVSDPLGDVDKSGVINIFDASLIISRWGNTGETTSNPSPAGWQIAWTDEFNDGSIDTSQWGVYDPTNNKGRYGDGDPLFLPCLTKNNVTVANGSLTIKSKKEQVLCNKGITTQYSSGFIGSRDANKYYPLYGRYEMRARIPHGQGIWPAFWLRHVNGSSAAEIDILEVFHHTDPGTVTQSLHFPLSIGTNVAKKGSIFENPVKGTGGWHIFAVDIEQVYPERNDTVKISFWVDNTKTLEYTNTNASNWAGIADQTKAWDIAINTAVGGTYGGHPDEKLGWDAASGGRCTLERPQRVTTDSVSCSKERTPGKWYNDTITKAPATDGIDDIWLAPWNYNSQTSADYIVDYVRFYTKIP
jgi:beta-glucanase (GH16 family)